MKTLCKLALAGLALVAAAAAVAQTVYRCQGPGGQVIFQQAACGAGAGRVVDARPANVVDGQPLGSVGVTAEASRAASVRSAIARGVVLPGMTAGEVQAVMGRASSVNTTILGGEVQQQLVYLGADGSQSYVYTRNGETYATQHYQRAHRPDPRPCYTPLEIRNASVSAGALTITPDERTHLRAAVERMRSCRR